LNASKKTIEECPVGGHRKRTLGATHNRHFLFSSQAQSTLTEVLDVVGFPACLCRGGDDCVPSCACECESSGAAARQQRLLSCVHARVSHVPTE
jgi:hypothetical protein